jgi:hypothetical protein
MNFNQVSAAIKMTYPVEAMVLAVMTTILKLCSIMFVPNKTFVEIGF